MKNSQEVFPVGSVFSIVIDSKLDSSNWLKGTLSIEDVFLGIFIPWKMYYIILSETCTIYNLGQNICRLFHFLAQLLFTTSETELDYYHHKANVWLVSRVVERLKT